MLWQNSCVDRSWLPAGAGAPRHPCPPHGTPRRGNAPGASCFKSCSNKRDFLPTRQNRENFAGMVPGFYPLSSISDNTPLLKSIRTQSNFRSEMPQDIRQSRNTGDLRTLRQPLLTLTLGIKTHPALENNLWLSCMETPQRYHLCFKAGE